MQVDWERNHLITASADGWIKLWDPENLISAKEVNDGNLPFLEAAPLFSICLKELCNANRSLNYQIMSLIHQSGHWILALQSGGLVSIPAPTSPEHKNDLKMETLWDYSAGGITGLEVFERGQCYAIASGDGTLSLFSLM